MRYGEINHFQTGLTIPLSALRSARSCGVGEYSDLVDLGRWAGDVGFDLIQILPIQDSGTDPSPYGAMSAFALHPLHLRLEDVEGSEVLHPEIEAARHRFEDAPKLHYPEVLAFKLDILRRSYAQLDKIRLRDELSAWMGSRPWLKGYACYRALQELHHSRPWFSWDGLRDPRPEEIERFGERHPAELFFWVFVQRCCAEQLAAASSALQDMGLRLKGDLPILLNEDSSDVWQHRQLFDLEGRAGAPPDMYSEHGQNWSFPCYAWDAHRASGYRWWRERLAEAARYFHAIRIDHVLGFFRIWRIPISCRTAVLGRFDPVVPIRREDLRGRGFSDVDIDRLAAPEGRLGAHYPTEQEYFSVSDDREREALLHRLWNRVLIDVDGRGELFRPAWFWEKVPQFAQLDPAQQKALRELMLEDGPRQERLWEQRGRERLGDITDGCDMLLCAEDLGTVPDCVPGVLRELGILGLRVERWMRDWSVDGAPFADPRGFERESVCSPGIHDAPTLRGWWRDFEEDRLCYWKQLGHEGTPPEELSPALLREILGRNLAANSALCVLALQDCLDLSEELRSGDPADDRINRPDSPPASNWRYRMPLPIEELDQKGELRATLRQLIEARRARPMR